MKSLIYKELSGRWARAFAQAQIKLPELPPNIARRVYDLLEQVEELLLAEKTMGVAKALERIEGLLRGVLK
jgi:hypothetical protein